MAYPKVPTRREGTIAVFQPLAAAIPAAVVGPAQHALLDKCKQSYLINQTKCRHNTALKPHVGLAPSCTLQQTVLMFCCL